MRQTGPFIMSRLVAHWLLRCSSAACRMHFHLWAPTNRRTAEKEKRSGMQESHPAHCYPAPRRNEGEESQAKTVREGRETRIILHAPLACSSESKLVRRCSSKRFMKAKHENKQIKKKNTKVGKTQRVCARSRRNIKETAPFVRDKQVVEGGGISSQLKSVHWLTRKPYLSFVFAANLIFSFLSLILFPFIDRNRKAKNKKERGRCSIKCGTLGMSHQTISRDPKKDGPDVFVDRLCVGEPWMLFALDHLTLDKIHRSASIDGCVCTRESVNKILFHFDTSPFIETSLYHRAEKYERCLVSCKNRQNAEYRHHEKWLFFCCFDCCLFFYFYFFFPFFLLFFYLRRCGSVPAPISAAYTLFFFFPFSHTAKK